MEKHPVYDTFYNKNSQKHMQYLILWIINATLKSTDVRTHSSTGLRILRRLTTDRKKGKKTPVAKTTIMKAIKKTVGNVQSVR